MASQSSYNIDNNPPHQLHSLLSSLATVSIDDIRAFAIAHLESGGTSTQHMIAFGDQEQIDNGTLGHQYSQQSIGTSGNITNRGVRKHHGRKLFGQSNISRRVRGRAEPWDDEDEDDYD